MPVIYFFGWCVHYISTTYTVDLCGNKIKIVMNILL